MTNKKVLIEGMEKISWFVGEKPGSELFKKGLKLIHKPTWRLAIVGEVEFSKNLTIEDKKALRPLLIDLSDALYELRNGVSERKLDVLEAAFDAIHEFCNKNNIEVVSDYYEEKWDEEDTDFEVEEEKWDEEDTDFEAEDELWETI